MDSEKVYLSVDERYSTAACGFGAEYNDTVAKAFSYSKEELASIPKGANIGLSCGNPLAVATLRAVS